MPLNRAHLRFLELPRDARRLRRFVRGPPPLFLPADRFALRDRTTETLGDRLRLSTKRTTLLPCHLLQSLLKTIEGTGEELRLALGSHVRGGCRRPRCRLVFVVRCCRRASLRYLSQNLLTRTIRSFSCADVYVLIREGPLDSISANSVAVNNARS